MIKHSFLLYACFIFACCLASASDTDEAVRFFVSPISSNLEIVTQVSNTKPFVGEQFSIIYSLRTLRAPSAVDLDPQQYSGFWAEPAQLSEQRHSTVRLQNGRQLSEYLLRQVIAFPLWPGSLSLPSLRVKIKNSDSRISADEWDVIGTSNPVPIAVKKLAPAPARTNAPPLAGELEGSLVAEGSSEHSYLLLELKGTANLALFQPKEWLRAPRDVRWSIRLKDWDNTVQTRDTGGHRLLSLLQWRRWTIRPVGAMGTVHIGDIEIPVFQPDKGRWISVRIQGLNLKGVAASGTPEIPGTADARNAARPLSRLSVSAAITAALLVVLVLALLAAWIRRTLVKKRGVLTED